MDAIYVVAGLGLWLAVVLMAYGLNKLEHTGGNRS